MTDKPRNRIVPEVPTDKMEYAALDDGGYDRPLIASFPDVLAAAPHSGRVSREQFEAAVSALARSMMPVAYDCGALTPKARELFDAGARAAIAAFGLEMEEE